MPSSMRQALSGLGIVLTLAAGGGCSSPERPEAQGGELVMRRLTEAQYRQAILDVFADDLEIAGRFEPDNRREGLLSVGSAWVTVTPSGFEQYEAMGRSIAGQVVSEANRSRFVPCVPGDVSLPDSNCAEAMLRSVGPRLLRRPLEDADIRPRLAAAAAATQRTGDFYAGLELIVTSLLVAPDFLFRLEAAVSDPMDSDRLTLDDLTMASRLSYLLWNAGPDRELLDAAIRGDLTSEETLARQVDRMIDSPRLEQGVRAFFDDVFRFDAFSVLSKDPIRYPKFSNALVQDAREQTLQVVVDHLVDDRGDYRDLFTTPHSVMTRTLGAVYAVPVSAEKGWQDYEFSAADARVGLLSHASFNLLNAHPGRSSATLRGVFMREALLCQTVPPAPADVDFGLFNQDDNPAYRTARERLAVHASDATCRNCHRLTDPIGLGLEVFDGIGGYRTTENGAPIDTSGELDGDAFVDHRALGRVFRNSPLVGPCLVENLYRYAVGREPVYSERRLLRHLEESFTESGFRLDALLRNIALSEGFRTATRSEKAALDEGRQAARAEKEGAA